MLNLFQTSINNNNNNNNNNHEIFYYYLHPKFKNRRRIKLNFNSNNNNNNAELVHVIVPRNNYLKKKAHPRDMNRRF